MNTSFYEGKNSLREPYKFPTKSIITALFYRPTCKYWGVGINKFIKLPRLLEKGKNGTIILIWEDTL
jgi:hypothetical protein